MSRRIMARVSVIASVIGLTLAEGRAGLIPGGGNPRTDCFVEFDVQGVTGESNRVACTDGDPCDTDGNCDRVCTFRVRLCVNQTNVPDCRPTTFNKPPQASFPLPVPSMHNWDSACGAFTDIPVKVKNGSKVGRKRLEIRAISRGKPNHDKDILFLRCLPRHSPCPTASTTTTTIRSSTTTTRLSTTFTTSAGASTTTTTSSASTTTLVATITLRELAATTFPNPEHNNPCNELWVGLLFSITTRGFPMALPGPSGWLSESFRPMCAIQALTPDLPVLTSWAEYISDVTTDPSALTLCNEINLPASGTVLCSVFFLDEFFSGGPIDYSPPAAPLICNGFHFVACADINDCLPVETVCAVPTTTTTTTTSTSTSMTSQSPTTSTMPSLLSVSTASSGCGTNPPGSVSPGRCEQGTNVGAVCTDDSACTGGGVCPIQLGCATLYFGGGGVAGPIPDHGVSYSKIGSCSAGTQRLSPTAATDVPTTGGCPTPAGTPTYGQRHCTSPGCLFGAPIAMPNPSGTASGICVVNVIANRPGAGAGTVDCSTGSVESLLLPLDSQIYVTGGYEVFEPAQFCSVCTGGTVNVCGSGICSGGPRDGMPCTPETSAFNGDYPTSHDCPPPATLVSGCPGPPGQGVGFIGCLPIDLNLTTGIQTKTAFSTAAQARVFCGYCFDPDTLAYEDPPHTCTGDADCTTGTFTLCRQHTSGAFSNPFATIVTEMGTPAGNLAIGAQRPATLVSVFCLPPSYNGFVDPLWELPGPGAVSLPGTLQFIP